MYEIGEGEGSEEEEEEEEEELRKAADVKYNKFKRECGHLLDPTLDSEFCLMKSLGLPTKLINSYGDMESEVREKMKAVSAMTGVSCRRRRRKRSGRRGKEREMEAGGSRGRGLMAEEEEIGRGVGS